LGAGAVVLRLREFYRPSSEQQPTTPVLLNDIIAQAISLTQPRWRAQAQAAGQTITVVTDLQPIPSIDGVATYLVEGLANLILNAVDAMPNGGTLTLRTASTEDQVIVEVRDTGVGMPAEVRDRIFEPFFTTKGDSGTGLGLALVRGIVERHGGEITVTSVDQQGTTFTMCFPIGVSTAGPEDLVAAPPQKRGLRVLLAEDEPSLRRIFISYLQIDRHEVVATADGRQAQAAFETGDFDLVITDRAMPEVNGDQLAAAVRRRSPDTPVIMLTGLGDLMQEANVRPEGVDLVVSKPVTLATFREAITQVTTADRTPPEA
jgi:CheY-like chemotaxis protein